jgi:hypothetical protein
MEPRKERGGCSWKKMGSWDAVSGYRERPFDKALRVKSYKLKKKCLKCAKMPKVPKIVNGKEGEYIRQDLQDLHDIFVGFPGESRQTPAPAGAALDQLVTSVARNFLL